MIFLKILWKFYKLWNVSRKNIKNYEAGHYRNGFIVLLVLVAGLEPARFPAAF